MKGLRRLSNKERLENVWGGRPLLNRVVKGCKGHKAGTEEEEEGAPSRGSAERGVQRPRGAAASLKRSQGETQGCETQEAQSLVGTGQGHGPRV